MGRLKYSSVCEKQKNGKLSSSTSFFIGLNFIKDIDYLEIRDGNTLEGQQKAKKGDIVAIAAKVGNARLIDNTKL